MPAQFDPAEDTGRGGLQPPHRILSISRIGIRKPNGASGLPGRVATQAGLVSGSGSGKTSVRSRVSAAGGGTPTLAPSPEERDKDPRAGELRGAGEGEAGPVLQVAAQAEEAAAAPAEGVWPGASRGRATKTSPFERFHPARSLRPGPARPRPRRSGHRLLSANAG